jgi:DNA-binding FadR family transcriptional regulator
MATSAGDRLSTSAVGPQVGKKQAVQIAERIEGEVKALGWPVGAVLGSEPELVERYGTSRSTFREAVRLLEHHSVASMRKGPGGGLVVVAPDANAIIDAVALYLEYRQVNSAGLFQTRRALELSAVGLATERLSEQDAVHLRRLIADEADVLGGTNVERTAVHPYDLHVAIAELSGDPTIHLFVDVVCRLAPDRLRPPKQYRSSAEELHNAHAAIVEAMISGDSSLARHRLGRHLEAVEAYALEAPMPPKRSTL